ncbi:hypothetical protein TraAM80_01242 [Trypanosoma rangeli]|uniref:Uncharacterized protein n=1 Tax=Trypanosoma rangeli TaxID=5698 RepID=A0A422NZS4_TRYRA|nr:uncharacterized protein TraAM80_01242 [Trypanosoma rangeli]RNF10976.1 hypothetical protein TraAM80_01242 [Trypanosoma rangeli]|eukprot:RNF10976.1 hypothetical protein TraAM80_01242 [Trypanosoma rangeli]
MVKVKYTANVKERCFPSSNMGRCGSSVGFRPASIYFQNNQKKMGTPVLDTRSLQELTKNTETQSRQSATSRSRCSSSVMELEETIADVMGIRMQSLTDLGLRIEELSSINRQEEAAFRQQMGDILQQLEAARVNQLGTENDYKALLQKERTERQSVMSLLQRFKTEGAEVINTMKESLREARAKWKAEVELNAQLTAQLRQSQKKNMPQNNLTTNDADRFTAGSTENALYTKVEILTRLLEEEDAIVVELQQRNKTLEKKVSVLTQQRNRLLDLEAQHLETEEFNTEYKKLLNTVCGFETMDKETPLEGRVCVLTRFTKMLLQRLQSEQRQRLRVEEQTVRMASEHDQIVRALEARIKNLEPHKSSGVSLSRQNVSQIGDEDAWNNGLNKGKSETPLTDDEVSPKGDQSIGQENVNPLKADNDPKLPFISSDEVNGIEPDSHELVPYGSTGDSVHATLEAQLAAFAGDFRQSVAEWITFPSTSEKALRKEDFCSK